MLSDKRLNAFPEKGKKAGVFPLLAPAQHGTANSSTLDEKGHVSSQNYTYVLHSNLVKLFARGVMLIILILP